LGQDKRTCGDVCLDEAGILLLSAAPLFLLPRDLYPESFFSTT
jgi:hypothetical protein